MPVVSSPSLIKAAVISVLIDLSIVKGECMNTNPPCGHHFDSHQHGGYDATRLTEEASTGCTRCKCQAFVPARLPT